uniref:Ubiquitin specific peptidase 53 n=1 Tax=Leptobrachium leishanense TaxID=445787 RepID=A0A8C5LSJ5_9ANUR
MAWVKLFRRQAGGNLGKVYQPGSVLSLAPTKGLFNEPGQNSCFLNSAVQSLFAQFQTSREKVLPSDAMRHALAESFKDEHRFQLGLMDDAAECFENILQRIHFHIVPNSEGDMCTSKSCITHQKFAMTLYEQCVCRSCGASSDPLPFTEFVRYISTTALCNEVDRMLERHERLKPEMFAELLQTANTADDFRKCPSNCGQKIKIRRVLMNCPEIVTIGLVWDSDNSDLTEDVVRNLATQLYLPGLFFRVTDEQAKESRLYLVGMICYTSKHYCAFAYHTKNARWVLFDDASVKEVGNKWKDVVTKCIRCHYQPLLLFYANPDGTAVTTEDALRHVLHWSHYKRVFTHDDGGNERGSSIPKSPEYGREEIEHVYQNSGPVLQMDNSAFNRGVVQSSAGRGPVKLGCNDQQGKVKDLSRECAQRAANLRGSSSSQRKTTEKLQKKEVSRPKETSGGSGQQKPYTGVQLKSGPSVTGNGFRQYPEPHIYHSQGKGPYKQERPLHPSRQAPPSTVQALELKPVSRLRNSNSTGYETDSSQEYRDKGNNRTRKQWRPMRETLNVDSIFNDNQKSPQSPRRAANTNGKQPVKEQSYVSSSKESPKRKVLMTIYEDEVKQESGSRSSLESVGKNQADRNKMNADSKAYHLESWQMQRTESGYESSDHISSGSSNLDSPVIEGTSFADLRNLQEASLCSEKPQPGNITLSTSPRTRRHLNGYNKENDDLEHRRCQDRLSPNTREPSHSPSGQRTQIMDPQRDHQSTNLLMLSKDYGLRDFHTNRSGDPQESPKLINPTYLENCCLHHDNSPTSRDAAPRGYSTNGFSNPSLHHPSAVVSLSPCSPQKFPHVRMQYMNSDFFAFSENQASSRDNMYSSDSQGSNSVPPPLPPKKYNRSAMPRVEPNVTPANNANTYAETFPQTHQVTADSRTPSDLMKPSSETDYYPRRDAFHNNELDFNNSSLAGSSMCDCRSKMVPQDFGLSPVSPTGNDTVSLTTYFSVDNCMTDTYRQKYHQKPRMYLSDSTTFNRVPFHRTEPMMEPVGYHRTFDHTHPSMVSRPKPSVGNVPCNR